MTSRTDVGRVASPALTTVNGLPLVQPCSTRAALAVTLSCVALPFISGFYAFRHAIPRRHRGAAFLPSLAAITLGVFGPQAFSRRVGRDEALNHGGNAASAALAAVTAYAFGPVVVFWIMAGLAVASIGAVLLIPVRAIDDDVAHGIAHAGQRLCC